MPYFVVDNFALGIDRRRPRASGADGSLWDGVNCHLSRGGDIEKRKAFAPWRTLPANTFGLAGASGALYVFGSVIAPSMPEGVTYQRLIHPDGVTVLSAVNDVTVFNGKTYVAATFADRLTFHFYDGTIVSDFVYGRVRADMTNLSGITAHLVSIITDTRVTCVQTGATTFTVEWNLVNVSFTVSTEAVNGGSVNDQSLTAVETTPAGVGTKEKWTVTLGGSFDPGDRFSVGIAEGALTTTWYGAKDRPERAGKILYTHNNKVYQLAGSVLSFSGVGAPTGWNAVTNAGAGSINMANHTSGSDDLTGIEIFQGSLAVCSRRAVQIWNMNTDPVKDTYLQTLKNTGTQAQQSVLSFGDVDTFYLDDSGVRSIKARTGTNAGFVSDVGTSVDSYVRNILKTLPVSVIATAPSCIEPLDGRYMLGLGNEIVMVFSYFPSAKISGWTAYKLEFTPEAFVVLENKVYARAGTTIYLLGGDDGDTYDTCEVIADMPFITGDKPGTFKVINGIDIIASGSWEVTALVDPRNESRIVNYGSLSGITVGDGMSAGGATTAFVAPKFRHQAAGPASLSKVLIHYEPAEEIA